MAFLAEARRGALAARLVLIAGLVVAAGVHAQKVDETLDLLVLEVRLDQFQLSSAVPAYDSAEQTFLPLGELARLLTIGIQTDPDAGTARGFVLDELRGFSLSLSDTRVTRAGVTESFDPALVLPEPDDIYVALSLLERWLPLQLEVDRTSMSLRVRALEPLPLQARLERERLGKLQGARGEHQHSQYPRHKLPYRLFSFPFIDQTVASELRRSDGGTSMDTRYTLTTAGDLLGMESTAYFSRSREEPSPDVRVTLGRDDPDGNLLGPLGARSVRLGSLTAPGIEHVTRAVSGEGLMVSNRPLTRPTQFDRQTFEGDLPLGWDVELYYNDALVGFQRARPDGRYLFEDQPLSFGRNDFRLVFHGPLGQTRVESHSFMLDQSMVRPGELQYSVLGQQGGDGERRSVAQLDLGVVRHLSASAAFLQAPVAGEEQQFASIGLRTFWQSMSVHSDLISAVDGGMLAQLGLQTRIAGFSVDANHMRLDDFSSDVFHASSDPILHRNALRLSGAVPAGSRSRLPVAVEAIRDEHESGMTRTDVTSRVSTYAYRTALTNALRWRYDGEEDRLSGSLQISRRVRDVSLRGQMDYRVGAGNAVSALAVSADKTLAQGYGLSVGVARTFAAQETRFTAGFTKSKGRYGLRLNASYLSTGDFAVGAQFMVAMGRDPQRSDWRFDAVPMAGSGAASARVFLDDNDNGVMDPGEEPLPGVGFSVDGGRHYARTDAAGIAEIYQLPVKQDVDVAVDESTLIDPQWAPQIRGLSLIPRPGAVADLVFPVRMTSEIDGTVHLSQEGSPRGMSGLKLELLNGELEVVAETTTSWDGFYILPGVVAGNYWLRVSPGQLKRLKLSGTGMRSVTVPADGSFVSGMDLWVLPWSRSESGQNNAQKDERRREQGEPRSSFLSESWVRGRTPADFTIQLMAARSESTVRRFIHRHQLQRTAAYVRTSSQGCTWYVVVLGHYSSYRGAGQALRQLPPALMKASPWIRRYGELQRRLTEARGELLGCTNAT